MPTKKYFDKYPPFPSDVPVVPLPRISFHGLENGEPEETERLFEASQEWGFFLLDLKGSKGGESFIQDGERMFDLTGATFALDQSILNAHAYNPPTDLTGYKQKGKLRTENGKLDRIELYNINQDDIMGNRQAVKNVETIESKRPECQLFIKNAHDVANTVLAHLDTKLGLAPGTLSAMSPLDQLSETSVRLTLAQSQEETQDNSISLGGHTDIGSLTLLFNVVGGLQILPAGQENKMGNWRYVKPEPGCIIVNIGDTLVEWSGGVLRSSLHRVVTPPGEQALVARQSVAYLARARNNASMRRLNGRFIPPVEDPSEEETRSVNEWAAWRAKQVMLGQLKPQTTGGNPVVLPSKATETAY